MPLALSPHEIAEWTGVDSVPYPLIAVAAAQIEAQTDYTLDAHVESRLVDSDSARLAWALVAVRVWKAAQTEDGFAVSSETQGDYSYSESDTLAVADRFRNLLDGRPSELLRLDRAAWAHI